MVRKYGRTMKAVSSKRTRMKIEENARNPVSGRDAALKWMSDNKQEVCDWVFDNFWKPLNYQSVYPSNRLKTHQGVPFEKIFNFDL